jgi:pimeloyl-ACP methyl ester carboxylesterase
LILSRTSTHTAPMRPTRTLLASLLWLLVAGCTGTPDVPGGVALLEPVDVGGMRQWILARGQDPGLPVLLWLHGGPGAAQMPVARHFNGDLEADFIVVHWDQRGAGKSNPFGFDGSTLRFERFVADVHELTAHLRERFGQERIFLLGHSWGSQLGLIVAARHPEDYHAYVGVAQPVGRARTQAVAHPWLRSRIEAACDRRDLEALERLGPPPFIRHNDYVAFASLLEKYGGGMDLPLGQLVPVALRAPEYSLLDYLRWLRGARRGSGPMWSEAAYANFDAFRDAPRLEIPAFFITGDRDYNTPAELTRAYVDALDAPRGKDLFVFDGTAHAPFMAEPQQFAQTLRTIRDRVAPVLR